MMSPIYVDQRFAFKNSGTSCLALMFNLSYPRTTILQAKKLFQIAICDNSCNLWLSSSGESPWVWRHGFESSRVPKLSSTWPLCVALSQSVYWHARFYISALSITFSFLDFVSGNLALTGFQPLTWTSDFHCFGALGVGPWARTHPL